MEFGQILVRLMNNITNLFVALLQNWKLVTGTFMILTKSHYNAIWYLLVDDFTIFDLPSAHLQNSKKPQGTVNWFLISCGWLVN